jgi:hypothetical protein
MKKRIIIIVVLILGFTTAKAQVAINTTGAAGNASAILDIQSDTAGILIPRMTAAQRDAITSPAKGLLVYVNDDSAFYYYTQTRWIPISTVTKINDLEDAKSDDDGSFNGSSIFLGTSAGLNDDGSNNKNIGIGYLVLSSNTTGESNVAIGYECGKYNTNGSNNTALGYWSLHNNQTGSNNTCMGNHTLYNNTTGYSNVAIGAAALFSIEDRNNLVAIGDSALYHNGTGASLSTHAKNNTALGSKSLFENTTGYSNSAVGFHSLYGNTTGYRNTATGSEALYSNSDGDYNAAYGYQALFHNSAGNNNVVSGTYALYNNTSGSGNTSMGRSSMYYNETGNYNVAVGVRALYRNVANSGQVAIGDSALFNSGISSAVAWENTAVGKKSLYFNTSGDYNTATGNEALYENVSGGSNSAFGRFALHSNSTGNHNTAMGSLALYSNVSSGSNSAFGYMALYSTTGEKNTAVGDEAGYSCTGNSNVFLGYQAGYNYSGNNSLYIDNDNNTIPLIYGDFSSRRVAFGTTSPDATVDIRSSTGEDALRVRVGGTTKLRVHANGSVSVGTSSEGPANGLESLGNIEPNTNKGADLGTDTKAWDDIYYDDAHNVSASMFPERNPSEEIINYPLSGKSTAIVNSGLKQSKIKADPSSLPPGLSDDNSLLIDEITMYNYKANYEQQLQINELKTLVKKQEEQIKELLKLLGKDK